MVPYMVQDEEPKKPAQIALIFFRSNKGSEPVREWLLELDQEDRRTVGYDLMKVQIGWPVGMPLCRSIGKGLWEVRSDLSSNRIARVIFFFANSELVALHGFVKKTQKTPQQDIDKALKRKKEYEI